MKTATRINQVAHYVPIIGWARTYDRGWLRDDLVSGVVVGLVMVPVAMAYAQMAGVPAQAGLYAAIVAMTAYAIFATSRHLKITTSSTMAIMSLAVVSPLAAGDAATFMALSSALALTVGTIMIALGILKLGFISDFLTKSVMTGYIFGVGCLIAISQMPKVFGVPGGSGTFFQQVADFIGNLPQTNPYSLALGAGTIAMILILHRRRPLVPGALLALVLGIIISASFQLSGKHGVAVVGSIPTGMTSPAIPKFGVQNLPYLIGGAAGIVFLAVGETLGTARSYAARYHYEIDADQELLALGAANVSSGLFQGITVDMSLSSTASGEAAGEHTQLSTLMSAGIILFVVLVFAPLLRNLPTAVLGAIVLSSILGLFNVSEFRRYYQQRKTDFVLAMAALMGVVSSSVMTGLALAVLLSLIMLLYRASRPYIAVLGKRPGTDDDYGDIERHEGAETVPDLTLLRLDAPLYFFNANVARSQILAHAAKDPPPQAILLDLAATADLDIGTSDMLRDLDADLQQAQIELLYAEVRGSVRQRMRMTGLLDQIGEHDIFASVDDAVQEFLARQAASVPVVAENGTPPE